MRLRVTGGERLVVVFVDGELDVATAPALVEQFENLAEVCRVVVDLRGVDFIDSHGLAAIITAHTLRHGRSKGLTVRAPSSAVLRLMSITGFVDESIVSDDGLDVQRWISMCHQDPSTVATRPDNLSDQLLGELLVAVACPGTSGSSTAGEVARLTRLVRTAGWSPSVALAHLIWVGDTVIRIVLPELHSEQRGEMWRGLGQVMPKAMAVVAEVAIGRLEAEALTDPLTGLGNRRAFQRRWAEVLADAECYGRTGCVAVCDLDGLKTINDRHGHGVGDDKLIAFAEAMRGQSRTGESPYRVGGDEFIVLLPGTTRSRPLPGGHGWRRGSVLQCGDRVLP